MPRDLPVGNGKLLICFDQNYCIRELYFPHVGLENHVGGRFCRLGVWVDGQFSWVGPDWERELRYLPDTLVTDVKLAHPGLGVALACHDAVDFHEDLYIREIVVTNVAPTPREIRLFFTLDLAISGNELGDTAGYDPKTGAVVHYKGPRYFLAGGMAMEGEGLSQFAVGQKGFEGWEGTFKDAEDGLLSGNPIAQGSVDSVIGLTLTLPPYESGQAYYWLAAGQSWEDVLRLDGLVKHKQPAGHLKRTADYWRLWLRKESPGLELLPEPVAELYRRSLLVIRTQIDWQGGILAANDSDVVYFNRDTYSYVWPRDGALVAYALDQAGHPTAARNFFRFISGTPPAGGLPAPQVQSRRDPGLLLAPLVPRGPGPIAHPGGLHRPGGLGPVAAFRPVPRPGLHQAPVPAPGEKDRGFHVPVPGRRDRPARPLL